MVEVLDAFQTRIKLVQFLFYVRRSSQELDFCFTDSTEANTHQKYLRVVGEKGAPVNILILFLKINGARYDAVQDITRLVLGGQVVLVRFVLGREKCGKSSLKTLNFRVRLALYLDGRVHGAGNGPSKVSAEQNTHQAEDYLPLNQLLEDYIQRRTICRVFSGRRTQREGGQLVILFVSGSWSQLLPNFLSKMSGINVGDERLVFESSEAVSVVPTFDELGLKEDLLRGVYAYSMLPPPHCPCCSCSCTPQILNDLLRSSSEPFYPLSRAAT
jgi:hypothetical protein